VAKESHIPPDSQDSIRYCSKHYTSDRCNGLPANVNYHLNLRPAAPHVDGIFGGLRHRAAKPTRGAKTAAPAPTGTRPAVPCGLATTVQEWPQVMEQKRR